MLSRFLRPVRPILCQVANGGFRRQSTAASARFTLNSDVYKLHEGSCGAPLGSGPPLEGEVTREEMTKMYSLMSAIREMETKAGDLYLEKIIRGFLHRCNGQEIKKEAKKVAEEAVEFARSSPYPPSSDLYTHILVGQDEVVRGCDPFTTSHTPS